jgi:signal peptidase I
LKRLLFLVALGAAGAFIVRSYFIEGIYLASDSMAPTLNTNDHVLVNKLIVHFRSPRRGEIVMFHTPQGPDKDLIKRVIAIGGDQIEIRKKQVYLNGAPLKEKYVRFLEPDIMYKGDNIPPIQIPQGYIFVMGDNRDASGDSRDWKSADGEWSPYVPLSTVKGVVILNK